MFFSIRECTTCFFLSNPFGTSKGNRWAPSSCAPEWSICIWFYRVLLGLLLVWRAHHSCISARVTIEDFASLNSIPIIFVLEPIAMIWFSRLKSYSVPHSPFLIVGKFFLSLPPIFDIFVRIDSAFIIFIASSLFLLSSSLLHCELDYLKSSFIVAADLFSCSRLSENYLIYHFIDWAYFGYITIQLSSLLLFLWIHFSSFELIRCILYIIDFLVEASHSGLLFIALCLLPDHLI